MAQDVIASRHTETLSYDEFKVLLRSGNVSDVVLADKVVSGKLVSKGLEVLLPKERIDEIRQRGAEGLQFVAIRVDDPNLERDLESAHVRFSGHFESDFMKTALTWLLPGVLLLLVWRVLVKRMGTATGGLLDIGKSKAKVFMEKDVKGASPTPAGRVESRVALVVAFLKDPASHGRLGARVPKGILVVGPPGTGKTRSRRAVAGEAGAVLLDERFGVRRDVRGRWAARVRDLFEQARAKAPATIFIDSSTLSPRARFFARRS